MSGSLVPNTVSAKAYFFAEGCRPAAFKFRFLKTASWDFITSLGLFSAGFAMAALTRQRVVLLPFIALFLFAYFQKLPGALFHNYYRYLYLFLPVAVLGWAACLGHKNTALRATGVGLGAYVAAALMVALSSSLAFQLHEVAAGSRDNREMAQWVALHVPRQAVILIHDAGMISTIGEQPLDLVGLKSPHSVSVHQRLTFAACRRVPQAIDDIARHAGATYMVVTREWDRIFRLTESLVQTGWSVERADTERGDSLYRVYRISERAAR